MKPMKIPQVSYFVHFTRLYNRNYHIYSNSRQKKGTAMGTKLEPVYATLIIGYLEDSLYKMTKGTAMGIKFATVYTTLIIGYLEDSLYKKVTNKVSVQRLV